MTTTNELKYTAKIGKLLKDVKHDTTVVANWLGGNICSLSVSVYDKYRLNNSKCIFVAIIDYEMLSVTYIYPESNYKPFAERYKSLADLKNHIEMIYEVDWDHSNSMFGV